MNQRTGAGSTPSVRVAAVLALLYGIVGVFAGASGTATFIPYRIQNGQSLETATLVTVISAIGAVISMVGAASGWRLVRGKHQAWKPSLGAALGCVATVAAFAVVTPPSTPSPVPGGPSAFVFLAVVAAAYSVEVLFLLLGRGPNRARAPAAGGT